MYTCPMHPEIRQPNFGKCPKCGMDLVLEGAKPITQKRKLKDFAPLIFIFVIIFGIFKLLNWTGFVDAYSTYDLIAKRSRVYGYAYPLIELALGLGYLFSYQVLLVAWITLALMLVGAIGVFREIQKKNQIMCACLGVVFKIPMTWVTFTEDLIMAVMAILMIIFSWKAG